MKTGFNKFFAVVLLLCASASAWAMPSSVVLPAVFGDMILAAAALGATGVAVASFAINLVATAIISKAFFSPTQPGVVDSPNPGNRQQLPPATDNKLPIIYGTAWTGGIVTDLSISSDNQQIYYVISLCEVTDNGNDTITFGDVYWGGKKVNFNPSEPYKAISLQDTSTGAVDEGVNGRMEIYFYSNGSNSPVNSPFSAIEIMQTPGLIYVWDETKLMTNCAFAIVHLSYNSDAGTTGLQQTKFELTNSRTKPGECFLDYLTNEVYGAAIPLAQIDIASFVALDAYCDEPFAYTDSAGNPQTQPRFRFDGQLSPARTVMQNLQDMQNCCDCLMRYNEILGKWGAIVQSSTYTVAMELNDGNLVSSIQISPIDIAGSYNVIEAKFPNTTTQDTFDTATFDLAEIDPSLLFPNEPVNKQSASLALVNNSVRAQLISIRMLKASREDLQVMVNTNFTGIQLEAGDIVTITNTNYGWVNKPFRLNKVIEEFAEDASVTAKLTLTEFNPSVYDDAPITQFQPSPNTGIGSPTTFGSVPTPTVGAQYRNAPIPFFELNVTASSAGIIQYAEVWYSAFSAPTTDQLIFAGTTAVQSNGNPYAPGAVLPVVNLSNIPQGNWYFFTRMVNSLGTSQYSLASTVFSWRPLTFQYAERYLSIRYADTSTGGGFSTNPRNKTYFGLQNVSVATGSTDPADYVWYPATFGTDFYLLFANRQNRKFSFAVGGAGFNNLGGAFVPSETTVYDTSLWSALEDGLNYIDLDQRTGQLTQAGTTSTSSADGLLSVTNNTNGSMVIALEKFLNFGNGVYSKNFTAATLTVDIYGRVVGFSSPDSFYFTETVFSATAGQTTFAVTHVVGQALLFRDSVLMPTSEYTETSSNFVLATPCAAGEIIVVLNMRAVSTSDYYEILNTSIVSSGSNTVTYYAPTPQPINAGDLLCFADTQPAPTDSPTMFTVASVNTTTKVITFTGTISGATAGFNIYRKRTAGSSYAPFSRYGQSVSGVSSFTPTTYSILNGFESIYINGAQINEADYDVVDGSLTGFPGLVTGQLDIVMFAPNNYNVPASNVTNTTAYSTAGALSYSFPNNPLSMAVYANGALLTKGSSYDYTATTAGYNLTVAISNNFTLLNQQTFARDGAA